MVVIIMKINCLAIYKIEIVVSHHIRFHDLNIIWLIFVSLIYHPIHEMIHIFLLYDFILSNTLTSFWNGSDSSIAMFSL